MVACCVKDCQSDSTKSKSGKLTFYPFPSDPKQRQEWLVILPVDNTYCRSSKVCNLHFTPNQFSSFRPNRLLHNATPFYVNTEVMQNNLDKSNKRKYKEMQRDSKTLHTCDTCEQIFGNEKSLKQHEMSHKAKISPEDSTNSITKKETWLPQECIVCKVSFSSHNDMVDHFHKYHKDKGSTQRKNPPMEKCHICQEQVTSQLMHLCANENLLRVTRKVLHCPICMGKYTNLHLFNNHITQKHTKFVQKLYFPTYTEFINWKQDVEQYSVHYTEIQAYEDKKIYHCKHEKDIFPSRQIICPSIILAQKRNAGIQVSHCRTHSHSKALNKEIQAKYKKYNLTKLLAPIVNEDNNESSNEEYLQLKVLLEYVIEHAKDVENMKLINLLGKALEMAQFLINGDSEENTKSDEVVLIQNEAKLSDQQISQEINEEPVVDRCDETPSKISKLDVTPKIVGTFTLNDTAIVSDTESESDSQDIDKEILRTNKSNKRNLKRNKKNIENGTSATQLDKNDKTTFNDTYKDFVTKTCVVYNKPQRYFPKKKSVNTVNLIISQKQAENKNKVTDGKKNNNVLSQECLKNDSSKDTNVTNNSEIDKEINVNEITTDTLIENERDISNNVEISNENNTTENLIESEDDSIISSANTIEDITLNDNNSQIKTKSSKTSPKIYRDGKIKKIKTKIGQFIPLKTGNLVKKKEEKVALPSPKKVDCDYEIIEQDSECNILVLKS